MVSDNRCWRGHLWGVLCALAFAVPVAAQEEDDWQLYQVDFETAQKPTGYPQGWVQVCMTPR